VSRIVTALFAWLAIASTQAAGPAVPVQIDEERIRQAAQLHQVQRQVLSDAERMSMSQFHQARIELLRQAEACLARAKNLEQMRACEAEERVARETMRSEMARHYDELKVHQQTRMTEVRERTREARARWREAAPPAMAR